MLIIGICNLRKRFFSNKTCSNMKGRRIVMCKNFEVKFCGILIDNSAFF